MESGVSEDAVSGHIQARHALKPYIRTLTLNLTSKLLDKRNSKALQACKRALHPLLITTSPG